MEKAEKNLELITNYFNDLTPRQLGQFSALAELYKEWNNKINVISRKDIDSLYEKHVLHSLSIAAVFKFQKTQQVLDIGTGGGFPGIPLAIFFPETHFHLIDSVGKKIKVVEAVAMALQLNNITTQHTRAEDIRNRKFDTVVTRAVAPLKDLWNWSRPLLRKANNQLQTSNTDLKSNGLICLKGGDLANEIAVSGCTPVLVELSKLFGENYFEEKYLLFIAA